MIASEESVTLILEISERIRSEGFCLLNDRRIELIYNHAPDLQLKIQRLQSFARLHHWQVTVRNHGHSAVFSLPRHNPHSPPGFILAAKG